LSLAQAVASARVICTTPPLLAAYGAANEAPKIDIMEPMLMILPRPARFSSGYAACEQRKALVRLVSMTACHSASINCSGGLRIEVPALLTRISSRPNYATASATKLRQASAWVTSAATKILRPPRAPIVSSAARAFS
jgi:hypothetical protein